MGHMSHYHEKIYSILYVITLSRKMYLFHRFILLTILVFETE